jgi:23S rRNA (guanine745-N1)-methyltransferase
LLSDVVPYLRCPLCAGELSDDAGALRCTRGHSFDVARQGYVNLLVGSAPAGADTPEMVAARAEVFAAGHFEGLTEAVVQAGSGQGLVVDAGAGTGHYLAAVLAQEPAGLTKGLALDIAKPAARWAAKAHPRIGSAVCDVWRGLPVADACADVLLDVFAPRNPAEFHRVLRPDGRLVVVTPQPQHLTELVHGLGLLGMDPGKDERLDSGLLGWFRGIGDTVHTSRHDVTHADALRLAAMGPSAFHTSPAELAARVAQWPEPLNVTISARVRVYRPEPR